MNTRDAELLLKAVQSKNPIPKEPPPTVFELVDIIKKIPETKNDIENKDEKLGKILMEAVSNHHQEIVVALLDAKVDPNVKDDIFKRSPLHKAAFDGHSEILKLLIAAKADIDAMDFVNDTPLNRSIRGGNGKYEKNKAAVQLLLEAKAKADHSLGEYTPLADACSNAGLDIIVQLIEAGAVPMKKARRTELDWLLQRYETDAREQFEEALPVIHLLLKKGAAFNNAHLYNCLCACDQRKPIVKEVFHILCEHIETRFSGDRFERYYKEHVLQPAKIYLKKLQVVMDYKAEEDPVYLLDDSFSNDHIAYDRKFSQNFNKKAVEELYSRICSKKHPYLSLFGLAPNIQPEVENKSTFQY